MHSYLKWIAFGGIALIPLAVVSFIFIGRGPSCFNNAYTRVGNVVSWKGNVLIGADSDTFCALSESFGKDANSVFASGTKIDRADPKTFHLIEGEFSADKNSVFWFTYLIPNASPSNFKVLGDRYSKTEKAIYYQYESQLHTTVPSDASS